VANTFRSEKVSKDALTPPLVVMLVVSAKDENL
jgi:hypothetical protein